MDLSNLAMAINENRRRKGKHAVKLRELGGGVVLVRGSGDQSRVFDTVATTKSIGCFCGTLEVTELLEHKRDHLKPFRTFFAMQFGQEGGFVVTIGAPATRERDDNHFAVKERIGNRDIVSGEIFETEIQSIGLANQLGGIFGITEGSLVVSYCDETVFECSA